jgi:hypothetical protein
MVEFAVALPLLIVLVVGIFDFGAAFNMKQELNNAMREGARFGAAQPTNDLNSNPSNSVSAIRMVVDDYLLAANINDCGLSGAVPTAFGQTWIYYASSAPCSGALPLQLTICRGGSACALVQSSGLSNPVNVPYTQVQISYPYQWRFNNVIQLLIPGAKLGLPKTIKTQATAVNMD